jgi:hypothetical protein
MCEQRNVELGFVVSLTTFRQILKDLRVNGTRWWIACDPKEAKRDGALLVGYGDPNCVDRLNTIIFRIPILTSGFGDETPDGLVLLIEPSTISIQEPGLYLERALVKEDFVEDWECFYRPLRRALLDLMESAEALRSRC